MRFARSLAVVLLILVPLLAPAQRSIKTTSFSQPPEKVFAAAVELVRSNGYYTLIEQEPSTLTLRFRINAYGAMALQERKHLASATFHIQSVPPGSKGVLTIGIMSNPGQGGPRNLTLAQDREAKRFFKALKKSLNP